MKALRSVLAFLLFAALALPAWGEGPVTIRVGKLRSEVTALRKLLSRFHSIGEVRCPDIELAHAGMQSLKRLRVVGW